MKPSNGYVNPLLTDLYEFTMAYAYFQAGRHEQPAVFDLFFRQNPFGGEFTIFAGLSEAIRFVADYRLSADAVDYVCRSMPRANDAFADWLRNIDGAAVTIHAQREGNVVFPRVPLLRIEGPIGICQLLESALLNVTSYPSLVATNAARMRLAAGREKRLVEFGLRRAQGPDGAVSAARYTYLGGFDSTSNMLAGQLFDIPVNGTQAHSFVSSFAGLKELRKQTLEDAGGQEFEFVRRVLHYRDELGFGGTHEGELASFITYAQAFPSGFLALVDTYDTLNSGVSNFLCVALALAEAGYEPRGIRLDSGDLAYLSREVRQRFRSAGERYDLPFERLKIVASNEIDEATLLSLNQQGHEIDVFGVGTHLVTCQAQPSLGCVYKLVEIDNQPRIKLSQDAPKVTIPGSKAAYRLIGEEGWPLIDLLTRTDERPPVVEKKVLCCHPYEEKKRTYVIPSKVIPLLERVWDGGPVGSLPTLHEAREHVTRQLRSLREDHRRPLNPTPYKVSLSSKLYEYMHRLWLREAPLTEIR